MAALDLLLTPLGHETCIYVATNIQIETRFCGPPSSGNGGYVAGLLAQEVDSFGCEVTLKAPPPLEESLRVEHAPAGASLWSGDRLIAEVARAEIDVVVPAPPTFAAAADAEKQFTGFHNHVFPTCFVCGPDRETGDGLRIFPGSLGQLGLIGVASTWQPDSSLADGSGLLRSEFVWAALDCPGYFAVQALAGPAVLGRLGVALHRAPLARDRMIITGWPIESTGRKHIVGTALHSEDGTLVASAKATWISINVPDWRN